MSSINDMKNQMMHNDNIKMCLLQKCEVLVPGARQSQCDVAKMPNLFLSRCR